MPHEKNQLLIKIEKQRQKSEGKKNHVKRRRGSINKYMPYCHLWPYFSIEIMLCVLDTASN